MDKDREKYRIIEQWAKEKRIENLLSKIKGQNEENLKDLTNDLYLSLLQKPADKIIELYNTDEINYFLVIMIKNNIYSDHSPYYKLYREFQVRQRNINEISNREMEDETE